MPDTPAKSGIGRHFARCLAWGLLFCGLMAAGEVVSLRNLPPGRQFILASSDSAALSETIRPALGFALAVGFFTLPALRVRRWIAWVLEGFAFYVLVLPFGFLGCGDAIAVVQNGDVFTFVRRFPLESRQVHAAGIDDIQVIQTDHSRRVRILLHPLTGRSAHSDCQWVRRSDVRASQTMDRLLESLRAAGRVDKIRGG